MNYKMVAKYLAYLIAAEAAFLLPAACVGFIYGEVGPALSLLAAAGVGFALALALYWPCRRENSVIYAREGFVVAGAGWILVSLLGALPFYLSGEIPRFYNAFFEAASGFTTTGASILNDVEALSHAMLFWRSFTHWLGGIGVLAFILAVVRAKSGAGFTLHLLRAETPGPQVGKILPKTRQSVRSLLIIYGGLSAVNLVFLLAGGMPLFDALCTMFGTAGTGGFGIKADSMAGYSIYLQNVTTVFMALFGVNFALYHLLMYRDWRSALRDEELRLYLGIMLGAVLLIGIDLWQSGSVAPGAGFQQSFFTVSSVMTTTGFSTANFDMWPQLSRTILLLLMICGAMAGSTAGGFKVSRLLILGKSLRAGLVRLLHPNNVKTVKINGRPLDAAVSMRCQMYLVVYCATLLLCWLLISVDGLSLETSFSATLACFNNVGPGLGAVGPAGNYSVYSGFSTVVLTFAMLLGRLEIFPILLLVFPGTWNQKN